MFGSAILNKYTKKLNKKFDKYLPLFDQIANSLVINDIYTQKNDDTNKCTSALV